MDVVKIDVDGGEIDVLHGMLQALRDHKPHLFIEVHSRDLLKQVEEITRQAGYTMNLNYPPKHEVRPIDFNVFYFSTGARVS